MGKSGLECQQPAAALGPGRSSDAAYGSGLRNRPKNRAEVTACEFRGSVRLGLLDPSLWEKPAARPCGHARGRGEGPTRGEIEVCPQQPTPTCQPCEQATLEAIPTTHVQPSEYGREVKI